MFINCPTYSFLQKLLLTPNQLDILLPDGRRPGSPEVVLVKVEDDLLPGRPAVLGNAAPQVEGIKVRRQKRLQPSDGEEGGEPVCDEHHPLARVASLTEERAVNPSNPANPSLVQRLLAIPQRVVGRLFHRTSVVRCENYDRVVVQSGSFEGVHNLSDTSVHGSQSCSSIKGVVTIGETMLVNISDAVVLCHVLVRRSLEWTMGSLERQIQEKRSGRIVILNSFHSFPRVKICYPHALALIGRFQAVV